MTTVLCLNSCMYGRDSIRTFALSILSRILFRPSKGPLKKLFSGCGQTPPSGLQPNHLQCDDILPSRLLKNLIPHTTQAQGLEGKESSHTMSPVDQSRVVNNRCRNQFIQYFKALQIRNNATDHLHSTYSAGISKGLFPWRQTPPSLYKQKRLRYNRLGNCKAQCLMIFNAGEHP